MGRRAPIAAQLTAVALLAFCCGEPRPLQHDGKRPGAPPTTAAENTVGAVGPNGEMIPGLALPAPLAGAADADADAGRGSLIADLERALAEQRAADAAAIADALLVLDSKDAEVLELRARALELLSDLEGAAADRKRCCNLGRASCCR